MADWRIQRRAPQCTACTRAFAENEAHYSLLLVQAGELARVDHCVACFGQRARADELLWWRTRHTLSEQRGLKLDLLALETLFLALGERQEEQLAQLRYLIALLLLRKRRLRLERAISTPEGEALLLRQPRRTEQYQVRVFELSPERQSALKSELERIFEGGQLPALEPQATPAPGV